MRPYPSLPRPFRRTVALDLLFVALLLLFLWLGFRVHDAVLELTSISDGVTQAGTSVRDGLRQAGDAVGRAPLIGGQLQGALQQAAGETGGAAARAGAEGGRRVTELANLLGVLTTLVPSLLLLVRFVPERVRQINRLTAGARVLTTEALSPERARLIAQRAAFGLPFAALLRHSDDPLGDLDAGRFAPLVAAEYEAAGLRPPRLS